MLVALFAGLHDRFRIRLERAVPIANNAHAPSIIVLEQARVTTEIVG